MFLPNNQHPSIFKTLESLSCDHQNENDSYMQRKLQNNLLCNYDKNIRPGSTSEATIIKVRLNIKDIDYDDDQNTMTLTSWMTSSWNDTKLIWSPQDYGDIKSIHVKSNALWTPDLKLYNSHIPSSLGTCQVVDCIVSYTSSVACVMPCSHTAHCKQFGINNWPFDVQNCTFTFGSWMKVNY